MPNLPKVKKNEVIKPPMKTSFHLIFASGNNLNISPNKKVVAIKVKILSVDEGAGKIGLSIRATEESPVQQITKAKKPRKRQAAAIIPEAEGQQGFNTLKDKLQEWIDQSQREDLIKK